MQPTRPYTPPGVACPPAEYLLSRHEFLLSGIQVAEATGMGNTLRGLRVTQSLLHDTHYVFPESAYKEWHNYNWDVMWCSVADRNPDIVETKDLVSEKIITAKSITEDFMTY
jgi:hypothetical protein